MTPFRQPRGRFVFSLTVFGALLVGGGGFLTGVCGPFTDVAADAFCPFVLEIFYLGITTGTTPTTYDPASGVSRLQMAAFLSRSVDGVLKRGSRRAALSQFWTPQLPDVLSLTSVGPGPQFIRSDGEDLWVPAMGSGTVSRVHASDGKLLATWTGVTVPENVLVAIGKVFITANTNPGRLYRIDPSQPAGAVTTVASDLPAFAGDLAFDGARIWIAHPAAISIVTPGAAIPWAFSTVTAGFSLPYGALFDGANVWFTDYTAPAIRKLDGTGAILQTVTLGASPQFPVFDGTNIWVPTFGTSSLWVVRASSGAVLATLTGNGLSGPSQAAFDGQRVLVTNPVANSVSLWKAADFTPLGTFTTGAATSPRGACSDGVNFWITLYSTGQVARF